MIALSLTGLLSACEKPEQAPSKQTWDADQEVIYQFQELFRYEEERIRLERSRQKKLSGPSSDATNSKP